MHQPRMHGCLILISFAYRRKCVTLQTKLHPAIEKCNPAFYGLLYHSLSSVSSSNISLFIKKNQALTNTRYHSMQKTIHFSFDDAMRCDELARRMNFLHLKVNMIIF